MKEPNTAKRKGCIQIWISDFNMEEQKLLRNQITWKMLYYNLEVQGYRWNTKYERWEKRSLPWMLRECRRK